MTLITPTEIVELKATTEVVTHTPKVTLEEARQAFTDGKSYYLFDGGFELPVEVLEQEVPAELHGQKDEEGNPITVLLKEWLPNALGGGHMASDFLSNDETKTLVVACQPKNMNQFMPMEPEMLLNTALWLGVDNIFTKSSFWGKLKSADYLKVTEEL